MTAADVHAQYIAILSRCLDVRPDQLLMSTTYAEDLGAEELDFSYLVQEVETQFKITLPDDDSETQRILTVGDSIKFFGRLCKVSDIDRYVEETNLREIAEAPQRQMRAREDLMRSQEEWDKKYLSSGFVNRLWMTLQGRPK